MDISDANRKAIVVAWGYIFLAGILEIAWAVGLSFTDGFTRFWPSTVVVLLLIGSFWSLALSLRVVPVGTSYAVWTGIGAAGTGLFGMLFLGEPVNALRILSLLCIIAGVVGLKLYSLIAHGKGN